MNLCWLKECVHYLEEVDTLDDVEADDDVDAELDVDKLERKLGLVIMLIFGLDKSLVNSPRI